MSTEVVQTALTPEAARDLTDRLREATDRLTRDYASWVQLVTEAYQRRAWVALGLDSWSAYIAAEIPAVRVGRSDRRELVATLTEAGMSTRAIGSALGVSNYTAYQDRAAVRNQTPESEVIDAELVPDPEPAPKVVGLDGKTYSGAPRDVPAATPRALACPQPKAPRRSRRVRAEAWEHATGSVRAHAGAIQMGIDRLVADAAVEDLDGMQRLIAALHESATAAHAARDAVQAAVDRLTSTGGVEDDKEIRR